MYKKVLIFIILLIILYDIYYLINKQKKIEKNIKKNEIINNQNIQIKKNEILNKQNTQIKKNIDINNSFSFINTNSDNNVQIAESNGMIINNEVLTKPQIDNAHTDIPIIEVVSPNLYGSPTDYKENEYIIWEFQKPNPWTKIIYKNKQEYPFYFFIKVKIPSLNDYQNWKNIIKNIDFDPKLGELIIPTNDEETALSITNLIISNFKGEISINDIINKQLIDISINKAKKYEIIKNKLKEQINESIKPPKTIKETFKEVPSFQKDLAENVEKVNELNPYEGTEYSFI